MPSQERYSCVTRWCHSTLSISWVTLYWQSLVALSSITHDSLLMNHDSWIMTHNWWLKTGDSVISHHSSAMCHPSFRKTISSDHCCTIKSCLWLGVTVASYLDVFLEKVQTAFKLMKWRSTNILEKNPLHMINAATLCMFWHTGKKLLSLSNATTSA